MNQYVVLLNLALLERQELTSIFPVIQEIIENKTINDGLNIMTIKNILNFTLVDINLNTTSERKHAIRTFCIFQV